MSESLFSQSWYRVAPLQPRLRSHVKILKHRYRGETWHVIQDQFTGRYHRFSGEAYQVVGLMNGHRTLDEIWQKACEELGDHMPTQDEIINLVSTLFRSDLLQTSTIPDYQEIEERYMKGRKNKLLMNLRSPLSVRFPLFDPDKFLTATLPLIKPFLGWSAGLVWLVVVVSAAVLALIHWPDLTENVTDALFSLENVFFVTLLYPFIKALHEFGHGYMVKKWGGEVHEMGIMLLVFMPVPYIEASSSISFENKYHRMAVGGAGILVELFVAAVSLFIWLNVEPGAVRAIAFNVMLIAGVSTLLFNGNPLLRFDAYYVLSDFLEIPNLGQRSNKFAIYLCKRYLLGVQSAESDAVSAGEAAWLLTYAVASFVYRIFLSFRIILFVISKFFFIGTILAIWAGYGMLVAPIGKAAKFLISDRAMIQRRQRIFWVVLLPMTLLIGVLLFLPLPYFTSAEGVTWTPDEAQVYAQADGFVEQILVGEKASVVRGEPLLIAKNPDLTAEVKKLELVAGEYQARYENAFQRNTITASLIEDELKGIEAQLERAKQKEKDLTITSPGDGTFVMKRSDELIGRYIQQGTLLGYVVQADGLFVRVVVPQAGIKDVRENLNSIEIRSAGNINQICRAEIVGEIPAASRNLPSMALSLDGGGLYALDPRSQEKPMVLEHLFQFDLQVSNCSLSRVHERVYVRFQHRPEPLARRWYKSLRRLLLSRFSF